MSSHRPGPTPMLFDPGEAGWRFTTILKPTWYVTSCSTNSRNALYTPPGKGKTDVVPGPCWRCWGRKQLMSLLGSLDDGLGGTVSLTGPRFTLLDTWVSGTGRSVRDTGMSWPV